MATENLSKIEAQRAITILHKHNVNAVVERISEDSFIVLPIDAKSLEHLTASVEDGKVAINNKEYKIGRVK